MPDILKINAVEYGGAVAHVAAFRAFEILSDDTSDLHASSFDWYGGSKQPEAEETEVLLLAGYTARTASAGEQLWRYGVISGVVVNDLLRQEHFTDLPLAYQLAFNTFASTCLGAEHMMRKAQDAALRAQREAEQVTPAPLALEDSIFEEETSLDDQDKHQKQFLKDQAEAQARAAISLKNKVSEAPQKTAEIGTLLVSTPAALSLGEIDKDETDAKASTTAGSETGSEAQADPGAQGEVPSMDDDGSAESEQAVQTAAVGTTENSEELASSLATENGSSSGEENATGRTEGDAITTSSSEPELAVADAQSGNGDEKQPSKSSKSKTQN